jgi:uncharacterized protein YndB with AHSA1/START domain
MKKSHPHTAPISAKKSIIINAPVATVWKALADINSWTKWNSSISLSSLDQPFQAESQFIWKSGGMTIRSTLQDITAHERLSWTGKAFGSSAHHVWRFTEKNKVTVVSTTETMDGWLVRLLRPLIQKTVERSLEDWLEDLKSHAERER